MKRERASALGGVTGPGQGWICECMGTSLNSRLQPWDNLGVLVMNGESSGGQEDTGEGASIEVSQLGNGWD